MDQLAPIDRRILDVIKACRKELGACTTGHLSSRMGLSRDLIRVRCHTLREAGLVTWTSAAGSLQLVESIGAKLYEQLIVSAVEKMAGSSDGTGGQPADEWCRKTIAAATVEAWYVPAPEQESEGGEDTTSLAPPSEVVPTSPMATEQIWCSVCQRPFKTVTALMGHERSNAHKDKLNEAFAAPPSDEPRTSGIPDSPSMDVRV